MVLSLLCSYAMVIFSIVGAMGVSYVTGTNSTVQQCNAMQCDAMQFRTVQHSKAQHDAIQCNAIRYDKMLFWLLCNVNKVRWDYLAATDKGYFPYHVEDLEKNEDVSFC